MKLISPDQTFLYYIVDRADGKSHGIRFMRAAGASGFVSGTPVAQQCHPVRFEVYDNPPIRLPVAAGQELPPIMQNVLGEIEDEHPQVRGLLSGTISFDDALR